MRYNGENLKDVLDAHKRWLTEGDGWSDNDRADLSECDLRGCDLSEADLSKADLSYANLYGSNMFRVDLCGANLCGASLFRADLFGANLSKANLCGADLYRANLYGASLFRANLSGASLRGANLYETDLYEAELSGTNLQEADLREATLTRMKNASFIPMACPDSGSFIGWKKCVSSKRTDFVIVKLLIPEDAKRCSATGRKCRCNKAVVREIQNLDGTIADTDTAYSQFSRHFCYKIGKTIVPEKPFENDRWAECASGIHFFINRQEAVDYD